jgi:hypothetical protein
MLCSQKIVEKLSRRFKGRFHFLIINNDSSKKKTWKRKIHQKKTWKRKIHKKIPKKKDPGSPP